MSSRSAISGGRHSLWRTAAHCGCLSAACAGCSGIERPCSALRRRRWAEAREGCGGPGAHADAAVGGHQLVLHVGVPEPERGEVHEQVLVDDRELAAQHAPHVDVARVRLEALVVAQDLRAGGPALPCPNPKLPCHNLRCTINSQSWLIGGCISSFSQSLPPKRLLPVLLPKPPRRAPAGGGGRLAARGRACEVDAVGMGASSSELRTPCAPMSARRRSQSQRLLGAGAPHMSCCSTPLLTGEPTYVSYGPAAHAHLSNLGDNHAAGDMLHGPAPFLLGEAVVEVGLQRELVCPSSC